MFALLFAAGCAGGGDETRPAVPDEPSPPLIETPTDAPDLPTSSGDDAVVLGGWVCEEGPEQEIAFGTEDGANVFQSYLDGRPMSVGTWRWYGNALAIEGTGGDYRFDRVSRVADRLTLEDEDARWVCDHVQE